jgi:predicted DNA-binding transcriptional regulator YafY
MMNPNAVRAVRLMYIRDLLREEPRTIAQLVHLCGVDKRTIYRDLIDLQCPPLNVPLQTDENGRWYIVRFFDD